MMTRTQTQMCHCGVQHGTENFFYRAQIIKCSLQSAVVTQNENLQNQLTYSLFQRLFNSSSEIYAKTLWITVFMLKQSNKQTNAQTNKCNQKHNLQSAIYPQARVDELTQTASNYLTHDWLCRWVLETAELQRTAESTAMTPATYCVGMQLQ